MMGKQKTAPVPIMFTIAHLTDFSPASTVAFTHALRLAVAYRDCRLFILHGRHPFTGHEWAAFPHVRKTLAAWGFMAETDPVSAIETKTGVRVAKVEVDTVDFAKGLSQFIRDHRPDLLVVATEGREGIAKWFRPSKAETVFHLARIPTLFVRSGASGFVTDRGEIDLAQVLVPIEGGTSAHNAIEALLKFVAPLGVIGNALEFMHVDDGSTIDRELGPFHVRVTQAKSAEDGILTAAEQTSTKLIVMPTYGPKGLRENLWGSTTERVVHRAPCLVLAFPVLEDKFAKSTL